MTVTNHSVRTIDADDTKELQALLGEDHIDFIKNLRQPTWIKLRGEDQTRSRAIITLLHANEPSGLKAIHQILKDEISKLKLDAEENN